MGVGEGKGVGVGLDVGEGEGEGEGGGEGVGEGDGVTWHPGPLITFGDVKRPLRSATEYFVIASALPVSIMEDPVI